MTDRWPRYFAAPVDPVFVGWTRYWMKLPFRWPVLTQCKSGQPLPGQKGVIRHPLWSHHRLPMAEFAAGLVETDTTNRN